MVKPKFEKLYQHIVKTVNAHTPGKVTAKVDHSPLTELDLELNRLLCEYLTGLEDIPIVSEELPPPPSSLDRFWLIDPLDGTKEFLNGFNDFCICVAKVEEARPTLGFVAMPKLDSWAYASASEPVFFSRRLNLETPIGGAHIAAISRSHSSPKLHDFIAHFGRVDTVAIGAATKFVAVAQGLVDFYPRIEGSSIWDTAAGQYLVERTGGQVVTLPEFQPLKYDCLKPLNSGFIAFSGPSAPQIGLVINRLKGEAWATV